MYSSGASRDGTASCARTLATTSVAAGPGSVTGTPTGPLTRSVTRGSGPDRVEGSRYLASDGMNPLARHMFELVEPIGVIPYSADEPNEAMFALGFTNYWDTYSAGRAAPPGASVPADVVQELRKDPPPPFAPTGRARRRDEGARSRRPAGGFTPAGRVCKQRVEALTDDLAI